MTEIIEFPVSIEDRFTSLSDLFAAIALCSHTLVIDFRGCHLLFLRRVSIQLSISMLFNSMVYIFLKSIECFFYVSYLGFD